MNNPREIWPNIVERIEPAFELAGVQYYHFPQFLDTPCIRAFYSLNCFEEMKSSCTRDFLSTFQKELDKVLQPLPGQPLDLSSLVQLNTFLKQRLDWVFLPKIAYKLCGIVFFDETENPMDIDLKYTEKKAEIFAKEKMNDFFFLKPISQLVGLGNMSTSDLQVSLTASQEQEEMQLSEMSSKK